MKQVTVLCSADLSSTVQEILAQSGSEGFLNVWTAVGVKPRAASEHGRYPRWQAEMFVAPVEDGAVAGIVEALREFANRCEEQPCLRILVSPLEQVF